MTGVLQMAGFLLCVLLLASLLAAGVTILSVIRWRKYGDSMTEWKRGAWRRFQKDAAA